MRYTFIRLTVPAILMFSASIAGAAVEYGTYLETFDTGYVHDATLDSTADWYGGLGSPTTRTQTGIGVNSSVGLTQGQYIFTWTAHPFDWNDAEFTGAVFRMDFQTDAGGHLDDDPGTRLKATTTAYRRMTRGRCLPSFRRWPTTPGIRSSWGSPS